MVKATQIKSIGNRFSKAKVEQMKQKKSERKTKKVKENPKKRKEKTKKEKRESKMILCSWKFSFFIYLEEYIFYKESSLGCGLHANTCTFLLI